LQAQLTAIVGESRHLESGLPKPQTVSNVDTEEMDWAIELRQILVSRLEGVISALGIDPSKLGRHGT